jgi:transcriptional regulator with XRE-family HTH domain
MITNDVQYRTAKAQADRLALLLEDVRQRPRDEEDSELRRQLEIDAVEGQIDELGGQLREYDDLREGRAPVGVLSTVDDLPRILVRARIAAGLSQRELAARLGLKEQQIQRYEATQYASASLSRLREVARELDLQGMALPDAMPTSKALAKRLSDMGLDSAFVRRRIAPAAFRDEVGGRNGVGSLIDFASRVGRVFGWETGALLSGERLEPDRSVLAIASFKLPKNADNEKVTAYAVYGHYLALVTLHATHDLPKREMPGDPSAFRSAWQATGSLSSFKDLLRFVWDLGIPVLPLTDAGAFHAAVWRVGGREVIVLKQGQRSASRWMFDLLHEIGHVLVDLREEDGSIIDGDEASGDDSEQLANRFAGDVLLDGRAEAIVQMCVDEAHGSVERLKRVVPRIAAAEKVDIGAVANYLAFRLSMQGINWWGAASNLQPTGADPWETSRDALIERADLASLNRLDRDLLCQALVA